MTKVDSESAQELMCRLQTKVAECEYSEYDRCLTELCVGGLNDKGRTNEIIREVAMLENIEGATSECISTLGAQDGETKSARKCLKQ